MSPTAAMLILCHHHHHHHHTTKSASQPEGGSWFKKLFTGWIDSVHATRLAPSALEDKADDADAHKLQRRFREAIEMASW